MKNFHTLQWAQAVWKNSTLTVTRYYQEPFDEVNVNTARCFPRGVGVTDVWRAAWEEQSQQINDKSDVTPERSQTRKATITQY